MFRKKQRNKAINGIYKWEQISNVLFIADRAYFKYELFNLIQNTKNYFLIRLKNNAHVLEKNKSKRNKHSKINNLLEKTIKNSRVVTVEFKVLKTIKTRKKQFVEIEVTETINLITNLPKKYTDEQLIDLYKKRWDVEVFFKFIKNNCRFSLMKEKDIIKYKKINECIKIVSYISKILKIIYSKKNNKPPKIHKKKLDINVECILKINESLLVNGIFNHLLDSIINSNLTDEYVNEFIKNYVKPIKNEKNRCFPRISMIPFSKWYVKDYHKISDLSKIVEALIDNTEDKLNKNLKLVAKTIKIIKIKE